MSNVFLFPIANAVTSKNSSLKVVHIEERSLTELLEEIGEHRYFTTVCITGHPRLRTITESILNYVPYEIPSILSDTSLVVQAITEAVDNFRATYLKTSSTDEAKRDYIRSLINRAIDITAYRCYSPITSKGTLRTWEPFTIGFREWSKQLGTRELLFEAQESSDSARDAARYKLTGRVLSMSEIQYLLLTGDR